MGLNTSIRIVPNAEKQAQQQPDFRIYSSDGGEIGGGWSRTGKKSGKEYISLTLAHPIIGPRKIYANLGQASGKSESNFAILWNPID